MADSQLYGLKQIAPVWGISVRHAQRLIKKYNIHVERIGPRGHIKMTYDKAQEIGKKLISSECRTLSLLQF